MPGSSSIEVNIRLTLQLSLQIWKEPVRLWIRSKIKTTTPSSNISTNWKNVGWHILGAEENELCILKYICFACFVLCTLSEGTEPLCRYSWLPLDAIEIPEIVDFFPQLVQCQTFLPRNNFAWKVSEKEFVGKIFPFPNWPSQTQLVILQDLKKIHKNCQKTFGQTLQDLSRSVNIRKSTFLANILGLGSPATTISIPLERAKEPVPCHYPLLNVVCSWSWSWGPFLGIQSVTKLLQGPLC